MNFPPIFCFCMRNDSPRAPPQALPFLERPPYLLSIDDVARILATDPESGLDDAQVKDRQHTYGPNAVLRVLHRSWLTSVVGRWRRGKLATNPIETNRQCNDVGPPPRVGCLLGNRLVYRRRCRRCCCSIEYRRRISPGIFCGEDDGVFARTVVSFRKRYSSRSCKTNPFA